ncbi:MAG: hypothetical protein CVU49_04000 [Candidatus Cloacimonetes bacterium HGW-Cloacimonetes-2]|jgi:hypothetical protein|nr:MAG: hypothetical protein CVU49_04000 [Candidatus Cloacimonetes bacterium HGW-Cloacimonetes-2]
MNDLDQQTLIDVFGQDSFKLFDDIDYQLDVKREKIEELKSLREQASQVFQMNLTMTDILVCASAGIITGLGNALFKTTIIPHDQLKKNPISQILNVEPHATRTAMDYKIPNVDGFNENLHRQLGPSHDLFRMKETLDLLNGENSDFPLWGTTITKILGSGNPHAGILRSPGMSLNEFIALGGFNIPNDPHAELWHHMLADFFTKTSLPIPGSTYIADHSRELAKLMFGMYDSGFNLKSVLSNSLGFVILQMLLHSYAFIFKTLVPSGFDYKNVTIDSIQRLLSSSTDFRGTNEFHGMIMLGHGSSFLLDTIITTSSQNYVGLFQLNFASLLWFSKHLLKYVIKCKAEYKLIMSKVASTGYEIELLDKELSGTFEERFEELSQDIRLSEFIDPNSIQKSHKNVADVIKRRENISHDINKALKELKNGK